MHAHDAKLMPGMLTPDQMAKLTAAKGAEFDRLFLEFMIQHHEGALIMVKELMASPGAGQESNIFAFASDVEADQSAEIMRMRRMRAAMGAMTTATYNSARQRSHETFVRMEGCPGRAVAGASRSDSAQGQQAGATAAPPPPAATQTIAGRQPGPRDGCAAEGSARRPEAGPGRCRHGGAWPRAGRTPPKPEAFQHAGGSLDFANSDLAFQGPHLFLGNFHGLNFYNVEDPRRPQLRVSVPCPGGQGDVSVLRQAAVHVGRTAARDESTAARKA